MKDDFSQPRLLLARGGEALEFLEPVVDNDQLRYWLGFPVFELNHQEPLAIKG